MTKRLTPMFARKKSVLGTIGIAAALSAVAAVPAHAASPNRCSYDAASKIATFEMIAGGGNIMEIDWNGETLTFSDSFGSGVCKNPVTGELARRDNTRSILFEGNVGIAEDFVVSELGGDYHGGAPGGSDSSQVEVNVFSSSEDTVHIVGNNNRNLVQITGGPGTGKQGAVLLDTFGVSGLPTVKFVGTPSVVKVLGLGGNDVITGAQFFSSPTSMHLNLSGGVGGDLIEGGIVSGDRLQGDDGDDILHSNDGQPVDIVTGGLGVDTAKVDPTDQASGVEKFELSNVGTLKLDARAVALAPDGSGTIGMRWTHPTSWKKLRSVTVSAYDGAKRVGSISIHPKSGRLADRGALRLAPGAKVSHHGSTVSARLPVRVAASVIGDGLRLQVEAVSTSGKRQIESDAGTLVMRSA